MLMDLQHYSSQIATITLFLTIISLILHVIFASAVAKDSGNLSKKGQRTILVNGMTWAFATLVGGVLIAAVYWVLHYSKLTRN